MTHADEDRWSFPGLVAEMDVALGLEGEEVPVRYLLQPSWAPTDHYSASNICAVNAREWRQLYRAARDSI